MSGAAIEEAIATAAPLRPSTLSLSPNQRAWARFRRNRLGFASLIVFLAMLGVSTFAELFSNDRPLVASYEGKLYFPLFRNQPEATFGGDFLTPTEWADPLIREQFSKPGNWAIFTLNHYDAEALDYFSQSP